MKEEEIILEEFYGKTKNEKIVYTDKDLDYNNKGSKDKNLSPSYMAEGNISSIEQFSNVLQKLIELTMPNVTFKSQYDFNNSKEENYPIITYDINNREYSEYTGIKPTKHFTNIQTSVGKVNRYSTLYDCNIEFCFYGLTDKQANETMEEFEKILTIYTGYLKEKGVSEIFFLKQIPSKASIHYIKDLSMKSCIWYVRLEKIWLCKVKDIDEIYVALDNYIASKIE